MSQKKHECEPPRQGESVDYRRVGDCPPAGKVWRCDKCAQRWELWYEICSGETYTLFGRRKAFLNYTFNWRRA